MGHRVPAPAPAPAPLTWEAERPQSPALSTSSRSHARGCLKPRWGERVQRTPQPPCSGAESCNNVFQAGSIFRKQSTEQQQLRRPQQALGLQGAALPHRSPPGAPGKAMPQQKESQPCLVPFVPRLGVVSWSSEQRWGWIRAVCFLLLRTRTKQFSFRSTCSTNPEPSLCALLLPDNAATSKVPSLNPSSGPAAPLSG